MNREIKFRAWNDEKQDLIYYDFLYIKDVDNFAENKGDWNIEELMQYTGLKDKNGKEIYEGDIVAVCENGFEDIKDNYEVKYFAEASGYPAFDLSPHWNSESNGLSEVTESGEFLCEVIGNIYENPELI